MAANKSKISKQNKRRLIMNIKNDNLYQSALDEMKKEHPNKKFVFSLLNKAHESGDIRATYAIATWYLFGEYVKKDIKKAIPLLRKSADSDNPEAIYDLAICYEEGNGVKKDLNKAFELYLKSALLNDSNSINEVGRCYYYGIGISRDLRLAQIWFERAKKLNVYNAIDHEDERKIEKEIKKNINKMKNFVGNKKYLKIFRSLGDECYINGFVIGIGEKLVLLQSFHDFYCQGYEVLRLRDIEKVESSKTERFFECMFEREGILENIGIQYQVNLTNFELLLKSLNDIKKPVIIECEENVKNKFYIGEIVALEEKHIKFKHFNSIGQWKKKEYKIEYNLITKVQFDTPYLNTFIKYL
jgi:hypothetical protein